MSWPKSVALDSARSRICSNVSATDWLFVHSRWVGSSAPVNTVWAHYLERLACRAKRRARNAADGRLGTIVDEVEDSVAATADPRDHCSVRRSHGGKSSCRLM